jgi:hypothetical protein
LDTPQEFSYILLVLSKPNVPFFGRFPIYYIPCDGDCLVEGDCWLDRKRDVVCKCERKVKQEITAKMNGGIPDERPNTHYKKAHIVADGRVWSRERKKKAHCADEERRW